MLEVYKMLITINNIIFADSNKLINDKIYEIELEFEKLLGSKLTKKATKKENTNIV